jgi:hypothetical protein
MEGNEMKYNIDINQLKFVELAPDLNERHAIILEDIAQLCNSKNRNIAKQRREINGEKYTWVDFDTVIEDLPILHLKHRSSISRYLSEIANAGFIKKQNIGDRVFITLTEMYEMLMVERDNVQGKQSAKKQSDKKERTSAQKQQNRCNDATIPLHECNLPYHYDNVTTTMLLEKVIPEKYHEKVEELIDEHGEGKVVNQLRYMQWVLTHRKQQRIEKRWGFLRSAVLNNYALEDEDYQKIVEEETRREREKQEWAEKVRNAIENVHEWIPEQMDRLRDMGDIQYRQYCP